MSTPKPESSADTLHRVATSWKSVSDRIDDLAEQIKGLIGDATFTHLLQQYGAERRALAAAVTDLQAVASCPEVVIATTGTTSSGKSTLANMLVGASLLPVAVGEMSAGVVAVHHHPTRRSVRIAKTAGATWWTGEREIDDAEQVALLLEKTMDRYRHELEKPEEGSRALPEAPRIDIHWPTVMGNQPERFGLPAQARLTLLDLPGLKYTNDEVNGNVVRSEASKALCLVTYNAAETDHTKQDTLLKQVVDQVAALQGSPSRMLFVLNRIDVFLDDRDPSASEAAFSGRITQQIREQIARALPEHESAARRIQPIALSSGPALLALQAASCSGPKQAHTLEKLEDRYKGLFSKDFMKRLPRSADDWSAEQRQKFLRMAREGSRVPAFEEQLKQHISTNLPELLLPKRVEDAYRPARALVQSLDGVIQAYGAAELADLKAAKERLNALHRELVEVANSKVNRLLDPLQEVVAASIGPKSDYLQKMHGSLQQLNARAREGDALAEKMALVLSMSSHLFLDNLRRLEQFVAELLSMGNSTDELLVGLPSSSRLQRATSQLARTPYKKDFWNKQSFTGKDATVVKQALSDFSVAYAETAQELLTLMASQLIERLSRELTSCTELLTESIEAQVRERCTAAGFEALAGIFRVSYQAADLKLPVLGLIAGFTEKKREIERQVVERYTDYERRFYTLFLVKHEVERSRTVTKKAVEDVLEVEGFGKFLSRFSERESSNGQALDGAVQAWLQENINLYSELLRGSLDEGVNRYTGLFVERMRELENATHRRVDEVEKSCATSKKEVLSLLGKARLWRQLEKTDAAARIDSLYSVC